MKKMLIVVLCAVVVGGGFAFYFFKFLIDNEDDLVEVNAFQVGAFTNYDNANKVALRNNGIVVEEDDIYRVYVAILYDKEAVNVLCKYYEEIGLNYYLKQIMVSKDFKDNIKDEEELIKVSSSDTYITINNEVLSMYEELL